MPGTGQDPSTQPSWPSFASSLDLDPPVCPGGPSPGLGVSLLLLPSDLEGQACVRGGGEGGPGQTPTGQGDLIKSSLVGGGRLGVLGLE